MTLEELKTGMREYFKKYKSQMTSKERKEFQSAILEVSVTMAMEGTPLKEKSDYAIVVGAGYAIRLFAKTEDEAREYYEQAVEEYEDMPVLIYKIFNPYE